MGVLEGLQEKQFQQQGHRQEACSQASFQQSVFNTIPSGVHSFDLRGHFSQMKYLIYDL